MMMPRKPSSSLPREIPFHYRYFYFLCLRFHLPGFPPLSSIYEEMIPHTHAILFSFRFIPALDFGISLSYLSELRSDFINPGF